MSSNKSLFRNGKIAMLLDQMEKDAQNEAKEDDERVRVFYRLKNKDIKECLSEFGLEIDATWDDLKRVEDELFENKAIHLDAYRICRSVRKYVPFIEAGAMTLAEAITIESQKPQKSKDEKKP